MFLRNRRRALLLSATTALTLAFGAAKLPAQEPSKADGPVQPALKSNDVARRVPSYFGQIGLTPEQRESIYKIRSGHQQKILDLQKQIADAQAAMLVECETVLTDAQKKLLDFRRQSAAEKRKATRIASATAPSSDKPVTPTAEKSAR